MTEVSSWSATDASNNLTPPDGWPEGMQPSGVNDVGRMMMGAIRRWYNTVSAGIANALPLSGGTLTGPLTAPGITSTGNLNVSGTTTTVALHTSSADVDGILSAAGIGLTGNLSVGGTTTTVGLHASAASIDGALYAASIGLTGDLSVGGAATAGSLWSNGTVVAASSISANSANITNSIAANSLTASALVNTVTYILNGTNFATTRTDGAGTCSVIFDGGGQPAIDMYGVNGTYYRTNNAHFFTNRAATLNICRFQATDGNCINASGLWNSISDVSIKETVEPYRAGLRELLSLNPVSYRYIPGMNPFAIEGQTYYGLVAQEVEPVLPEMVGRTDDGLATVAPGHLVLVLVSAVKELEARLAQLENRGG